MKIDINPDPYLDINYLDKAISVDVPKPPAYLIMNYSTLTTLRDLTDYYKENDSVKCYFQYRGIKICLCEALEYGQIDIMF